MLNFKNNLHADSGKTGYRRTDGWKEETELPFKMLHLPMRKDNNNAINDK